MMAIILAQVEAGPPVAYIITAVAAVIASMGLKELWPYIFNKGKTDCEKKLIRLSSQVAILFKIMRDKFTDEPAIQEGMDDVNEFIDELRKKK